MKFGAVESRPYLQNRQARRILDAAQDVFVAEGAGAFSARRVARAAGLSLGSVQHVFPTSDALLGAMLEHVNDSYEAAYQAMALRLPADAGRRLAAVVDFLLADICDPDMRRFWLGFWALSCHNPQAQAMLERAYRHHLANMASFIAAARPDLKAVHCRALAREAVALIEGTMLLAGLDGRPASARSPLIRGARGALLSRLAAAPAPR